jgi:hypothetical protein
MTQRQIGCKEQQEEDRYNHAFLERVMDYDRTSLNGCWRIFGQNYLYCCASASACLRLHSKLLSCACESESSSKVEKKKIGTVAIIERRNVSQEIRMTHAVSLPAWSV